MVLHLHVASNVPTPAGEMAATKHVRPDGFGYSCILASVQTNVTSHQTLQLGSGRTVPVENVFPLVVFTSSQLISPCPSVTDTPVTCRVTDIPSVLRETHAPVQAQTAAYSQGMGSTKHPACCCVLHGFGGEKKKPCYTSSSPK